MGKKLKRVQSTLHYWIVDPWLADEDGGGDARTQPSKAAKKTNKKTTRNTNKKDKKGNKSTNQTAKAKVDDFKKNVHDNMPFRDTLRRASKTFHYWVIDPWLPDIKPDPPARYRAPRKPQKPSMKSRFLSLIGMNDKPKSPTVVPRPTPPAAKSYTIRRYGSIESVASVITEYHVTSRDVTSSLDNYLMCEDEIVDEVTTTLDNVRAATDGLAAFARDIEAVCNDVFKVTLCQWPVKEGVVA